MGGHPACSASAHADCAGAPSLRQPFLQCSCAMPLMQDALDASLSMSHTFWGITRHCFRQVHVAEMQCSKRHNLEGALSILSSSPGILALFMKPWWAAHEFSKLLASELESVSRCFLHALCEGSAACFWVFHCFL